MLGSLPKPTRPPARGCRSKVVQPQPALDGPHRGRLVLGVHPHQLDSDATGTPAGMLTPQPDGGLQQRRRKWARSTGVIAGLQCCRRLIGRGLSSSRYQTSYRAQGQIKLSTNFRRGCSEPHHAIEDQPKRKIRSACHSSRLLVHEANRPGQSLPGETKTRNFVSRDRLLPSQAYEKARREARTPIETSSHANGNARLLPSQTYEKARREARTPREWKPCCAGSWN
jgi:hypothetical protein